MHCLNTFIGRNLCTKTRKISNYVAEIRLPDGFFHNFNTTPVLVGPDLVELLGPMGSFLAAFRASGHLNLGLGLRGVG